LPLKKMTHKKPPGNFSGEKEVRKKRCIGKGLEGGKENLLKGGERKRLKGKAQKRKTTSLRKAGNLLRIEKSLQFPGKQSDRGAFSLGKCLNSHSLLKVVAWGDEEHFNAFQRDRKRGTQIEIPYSGGIRPEEGRRANPERLPDGRGSNRKLLSFSVEKGGGENEDAPLLWKKRKKTEIQR